MTDSENPNFLNKNSHRARKLRKFGEDDLNPEPVGPNQVHWTKNQENIDKKARLLQGIIQELKANWVDKNGPMELQLSDEERQKIEDEKYLAKMTGQAWNDSVTLTPEAIKFLSSISNQAEQIFAERYPEHAQKPADVKSSFSQEPVVIDTQKKPANEDENISLDPQTSIEDFVGPLKPESDYQSQSNINSEGTLVVESTPLEVSDEPKTATTEDSCPDKSVKVNEFVGPSRSEVTGATTVQEVLDPEMEKELYEKLLEGLSPEEQEKAKLGIHNFGHKLQALKASSFSKVFGLMSKRFDQETTGGRFFTAWKEQFDEKEKKALDTIESLEDKKAEGGGIGKLDHLGNIGSAAGNALKYGRLAADAAGITVGFTQRLPMLLSMAAASGSEAAKEARLKNHEVIERTRIQEQDIEEAAEEAWKIHEIANQRTPEGEKVSRENLQKIYEERVPKDILKRLAKNPQPFTGTKMVQYVFQKHANYSVSRINKKFEKIDSDESITDKQKEAKKERILNGWLGLGSNRSMLKDYDRLLSQQGALDTVGMFARYTEKTAKVAVYGMMADSISKLYDQLLEVITSPEADEFLDSVEGYIKDENLDLYTAQEFVTDSGNTLMSDLTPGGTSKTAFAPVASVEDTPEVKVEPVATGGSTGTQISGTVAQATAEASVVSVPDDVPDNLPIDTKLNFDSTSASDYPFKQNPDLPPLDGAELSKDVDLPKSEIDSPTDTQSVVEGQAQQASGETSYRGPNYITQEQLDYAKDYVNGKLASDIKSVGARPDHPNFMTQEQVEYGAKIVNGDASVENQTSLSDVTRPEAGTEVLKESIANNIERIHEVKQGETLTGILVEAIKNRVAAGEMSYPSGEDENSIHSYLFRKFILMSEHSDSPGKVWEGYGVSSGNPDLIFAADAEGYGKTDKINVQAIIDDMKGTTDVQNIDSVASPFTEDSDDLSIAEVEEIVAKEAGWPQGGDGSEGLRGPNDYLPDEADASSPEEVVASTGDSEDSASIAKETPEVDVVPTPQSVPDVEVSVKPNADVVLPDVSGVEPETSVEGASETVEGSSNSREDFSAENTPNSQEDSSEVNNDPSEAILNNRGFSMEGKYAVMTHEFDLENGETLSKHIIETINQGKLDVNGVSKDGITLPIRLLSGSTNFTNNTEGLVAQALLELSGAVSEDGYKILPSGLEFTPDDWREFGISSGDPFRLSASDNFQTGKFIRLMLTGEDTLLAGR